MIKTIKSKYGEDLLLILVSIMGCLELYFIVAYFFVTLFGEAARRSPGFSLLSSYLIRPYALCYQRGPRRRGTRILL
jgi:hypothetical protein